MRRYFFTGILLPLLAACTPKPPDIPVCEFLHQQMTTDPVTKHVMLTPSPACMSNLSEAECGHCVWIVSGDERFIGEAHKMVPLKTLAEDAHGKLVWKTLVDEKGKPVMVSTWLMDKKPWSQVNRESAYLPAEESYAPLAGYVIDSCKKMKCSDEVTRFKIKLDSLNGIAGAIKN